MLDIQIKNLAPDTDVVVVDITEQDELITSRARVTVSRDEHGQVEVDVTQGSRTRTTVLGREG
jgi:signal transduction histidine kinase